MLRHAHTVLGAWIVLNVAAVPVAAQETLRDVVRRSGDTNTMVLREFSPMTLRDLVSGSDLTAHVLIRGRKSHVTADERNVVSQYTAQVVDVYMKADSTRKVGAEITIVRPGGSVILEGHQVQASEPDFPGFELGAEYDAAGVESHLGADVLRHELVIAGENLDLDAVFTQGVKSCLRSL